MSVDKQEAKIKELREELAWAFVREREKVFVWPDQF